MPIAFVSYLDAAPFAASALAVGVTLYVFASIKVELRRATKRYRERIDKIEIELAARAAPVTKKPETVSEAPLPVPFAPRPGFNIPRSVHALRLLRRGQDPGHISATLGMPRREVELVDRVLRLVSARGSA